MCYTWLENNVYHIIDGNKVAYNSSLKYHTCFHFWPPALKEHSASFISQWQYQILIQLTLLNYNSISVKRNFTEPLFIKSAFLVFVSWLIRTSNFSNSKSTTTTSSNAEWNTANLSIRKLLLRVIHKLVWISEQPHKVVIMSSIFWKSSKYRKVN